MALMTTAEVMVAMGQTTTVQAVVDRFDALRLHAEAAIKTYCKWGIEESSATEYLSGTGTPTLSLKNPFVSDVDFVKVDNSGAWGQKAGSFADANLTKGVDYALVIDGDGGVGKSASLRRLANPTYASPGWPSSWFPWNQLGGVTYGYAPRWEYGQGNIKANYTYGFADCPEDIKAAVVQTVALLYEQEKSGIAVTSQSLGAHSYSGQIGGDPTFADVRKLLAPYRLTAI